MKIYELTWCACPGKCWELYNYRFKIQ